MGTLPKPEVQYDPAQLRIAYGRLARRSRHSGLPTPVTGRTERSTSASVSRSAATQIRTPPPQPCKSSPHHCAPEGGGGGPLHQQCRITVCLQHDHRHIFFPPVPPQVHRVKIGQYPFPHVRHHILLWTSRLLSYVRREIFTHSNNGNATLHHTEEWSES